MGSWLRALVPDDVDLSIMLECLHSTVAVGSLQRCSPREQGEAALPFVIETQKLHTVTSAISWWLYLFNLG